MDNKRILEKLEYTVQIYNQLFLHEEIDVDFKNEIVECLDKLKEISIKIIARDIRHYARRQLNDY